MRKTGLIFLIAVASVHQAFAQPLPPPPPNVAIPLDVVVGVLVFCALAYGSLKLWRKSIEAVKNKAVSK
jgi:hypothetical protein